MASKNKTYEERRADIERGDFMAWKSPVKITVLKKLAMPELFDEYGVSPEGWSPTFTCHVLEEGDEILVEDYDLVPEAFCAWAWADLHKSIAHLALGGDFPWIKKPGTMITACSNGLTPVIFKLERV